MIGKNSIERAGRVVISKCARGALGVRPGDALVVTYDTESVTLRPEQPKPSLRRERGVWVLQTGVALSQEEANMAVEVLRAKMTSGQD